MTSSLKLHIANHDSIQTIQSILDGAPGYYLRTEGVSRVADGAKKTLEELPPNCTYADKFVFLITQGDRAIGVADIVFGYPARDVAFIGLLLLHESVQGQGLGKESYELMENFIVQKSVTKIQLGVNDTNDIGMAFWKKLGFTPNGRTRPNYGLQLKSTVHVLEKIVR